MRYVRFVGRLARRFGVSAVAAAGGVALASLVDPLLGAAVSVMAGWCLGVDTMNFVYDLEREGVGPW